MDAFLRDLRFALRSFSRSPLFVVVAALTLGLGLGVNATIFTFVNAILLRPLPIADPASVLTVFSSWDGETHATSSWADYEDLAATNEVFSDLVGHGMSLASLQHDGKSEIVVGELVSGNYFRALGIGTRLGRTLLDGDDEVGSAAPVVVLGHGLWQRRFGGDESVLGRPVRFNGKDFEVVGIAPASFPGLTPGLTSDYWIPAIHAEEIDPAGQIHGVHGDPGRTALERRGYRWMWMKGRLLPGVSAKQAQTHLAGLMAGLANAHPITNADRTIAVLPASAVRIHPDVDKVLGPAAAVLLAAVGLVLLIVCANLANMMIGRAQTRRREVAIRLALGAGRGRLLRQLFIEGAVLATFGWGVALLFATWTSRLLVAYQPPIPFSLTLDLGLDFRVILFTIVLAYGSTFVFAMVPAIQASRPDLVPALRQGDRGSSGGAPGFFSLRNLLVVAQVAISLVLLVGGALLTRGLVSARTIDVGLEPDRVAVVLTSLGMHGYSEEEAHEFLVRVRERVAEMPGVASASLATRVPFDINRHNTSILPASMDLGGEHAGFAVESTWIDERFLETVDVPLLHGRGILASDIAAQSRVAVVNETLAQRFWKRSNVVGELFHRGGLDSAPFTIVGVSRDHKVGSVGEDPTPFVQYAMNAQRAGHGYVLARSESGDATPLAATIKGVMLEMDPDLAFGETTTLARLMDVTLYPIKMGTFLLGLFGALALALASLGLYGVLASAVVGRSREIGVRIALGASPSSILALVTRGGMGLVAVGVAVGVALAAAGSQFLEAVLYGTRALDPVAFVGAAALLCSVALVANLIPAMRAARVDPLKVLRQD